MNLVVRKLACCICEQQRHQYRTHFCSLIRALLFATEIVSSLTKTVAVELRCLASALIYLLLLEHFPFSSICISVGGAFGSGLHLYDSLHSLDSTPERHLKNDPHLSVKEEDKDHESVRETSGYSTSSSTNPSPGPSTVSLLSPLDYESVRGQQLLDQQQYKPSPPHMHQ